MTSPFDPAAWAAVFAFSLFMLVCSLSKDRVVAAYRARSGA